MNIKSIRSAFITDLRFIIRDPALLIAFIIPVFFVLALRLVFPLLAENLLMKSSIQNDGLYTIAAVSLVSLIPVMVGIIFGYILFRENIVQRPQDIPGTPAEIKSSLHIRSLIAASVSFVLLITTIILTVPVNSEGWLRALYISALLSFQSTFIALLTVCLSTGKQRWLALSIISGVFMISVPLGLLVHNPWNYLLFFSPFYWISWAWVIPSSFESLAYGAIAIIITSGYVLLLFRYFLRKQSD